MKGLVVDTNSYSIGYDRITEPRIRFNKQKCSVYKISNVIKYFRLDNKKEFNKRQKSNYEFLKKMGCQNLFVREKHISEV